MDMQKSAFYEKGISFHSSDCNFLISTTLSHSLTCLHESQYLIYNYAQKSKSLKEFLFSFIKMHSDIKFVYPAVSISLAHRPDWSL